MSVAYFLLLLGALVVIHEFGHFVAAKLLDFKVVRFSIGFGRPLVRVSTRETEYQVCVFPLGGYVRILGEDEGEDVAPEDARRSFRGKPMWQRLVVVFAGSAANLMFPVVLYFLVYAGHSQLPAAVIGDVIDGSPAARAGLEPGDRFLTIDGEPVRYWEQVAAAVDARAGGEMHVRVRRGTRELEKHLLPVERVIRTRDGRSKRQGWIGVSQAPFRPQIAVLDERSPAGRAGLRTGDLVISIDGEEVRNATTLRRRLRGDAGRRTVAYFRGEPVAAVPNVRLLRAGVADLVPEADGREVVTGIASGELLISAVEPGSPAHRAGLRAGDLLTALDGEPIAHWLQLDQDLQSAPDRVWQLRWLRATPDGGAVEMAGELRQEPRTVVDEYGNRTRALAFGASNDYEKGDGELVDIDERFGYAFGKSVERTVDTTVAMTGGFWSIVRGETPREHVGGPMMMYRVASVSGAKGWDSFLLMLALVSVNLGLINLLPVPMLDGGQVLVFAIEAAQRRPLSARARERVMLVGLAVVLCITVLALRNDVIRYVM